MNMERNPGQELEALRADYNALKAQMKQQERLNERFFKAARLRPAQAVSKGIRNRMILDVLTLPTIWIICITTHWPLLFGVLVSLDVDRSRCHNLDQPQIGHGPSA